MLIDPLVLKKKLNRMATEHGAFAVLSSLLLYVTELAACDPQLSSKRTKWAEGKENQVSRKQSSPDSNRGQYPTRFQLLRSRFLNNNREPYTKKRREVGKLVIKERLWVSRTGNKLERRGDGKAAEEGEDTVPSERVRWGGASGKNTVKNILKKFLAAEEKEAKEKIPSWKKKGPNSGLPKIVNRSSVLSKLKEQFEQSSLCSATEVKASLLRKGEKKTKTFPSRKAIRKPEVRVLRTAALAATDINHPESQYLVCSTVPVPRLSMATEINHPWSWSKNNATMQPCDHNTELKGKGNSERKPDENKTSPHAAQDKEEPVAPKEMPDSMDVAETNIDSPKQRPHFNPSLGSSSSNSKNKALADGIPPSSEHRPDCDRNNLSSGPDASSLMETASAVQHVKDDSPPSNSPYSSTAEGSCEPSPQDTKTGEIPEIVMYVYSSEETDPELTEPEKDPFFAGQRHFPEQKELESALPFHFPGVQASCEVEPPMQNRQLTHVIKTAGKRQPAVKKEAPGLRGRYSKEAKEGEKYRSEDKMCSTSSKNDGDVPPKKEQENKTPNCQMQDEPKPKQPLPPQISSPQNHFGNSSAETSNPDANQTKPTLSSDEIQEQKPGAAEECVPSDWEKKEGPLPDELVRHKLYFADEDFGKDQLSSSNEMMSLANNGVLDRSTFTDLETGHKPSNYFIKREETTADEMPCPDAETCLSPSPNPVTTPVSGIAGQRIHHTLGNPPALPPSGLVKPGAGGVDNDHASHGSEKHPPPSSDESTVHEKSSAMEKKTACDFMNQPLTPKHATENEYTAAEETTTCQSLENCLPLSRRKGKMTGKHANKTAQARKPLSLLRKDQTQISDDNLKQGSDMLEENLFPSSAELVSDRKKYAKDTDNVSKYTKHKPLPSGGDTKHDDDRMETEEREELNVLHKFEQEQVSTPSDMMDLDNGSSNEKVAHSPQTSRLPPSEHDSNRQEVENTGQGLKCLTPSIDFVKHEHDMTVDENICCNHERHQLSSSNEPMNRASNTAGRRNITSKFMPPRNTARHDNKSTGEDNTFRGLKNYTVQHKKSYEEERNIPCDPKNPIPSSNPPVKQDKKFSPLDTQQQVSPGGFVTPGAQSAEKKTKHSSEKPQSPSPSKVEKPRERSSSAEKKQKAPAAEDVRPPRTKAVKGDDEHQHPGKHELPPSSKSAKPGKSTPGGEKQQTRSEDFTMPDTNTKEKNKLLRPTKYRSLSSETVVKPQERHSPDQKQQTSAAAGFKKPGTPAVKEKDEGPNAEKLLTPSSNKGVNSKEKNTSGERKQKTAAAGDVGAPKTKAAKQDGEHQHCGKQQVPPPSKSAKPGKNTPGGEKQETVAEGFTKPDANAVKDKSKDPGSGIRQPSSPNLLLKLQEENDRAKKKPSAPPSDQKMMGRTGSPEKRSGPQGTGKYQLQPSDRTEKHSNGKEGSERNQTALPSSGTKCRSSTVPKETNLSQTEKSPKSSPSHDAPTDDKGPTENRKKQPGFKKYQALSSKGLVKHERGAAGREAGWQAASRESDSTAELGDCSKTAPFSKYTVESYSEGPLDSSFKPLVITVNDTFKHHS